MVPLILVAQDPQSPIGLFELRGESTSFVLVDRHKVDGIPITKDLEEYRVHV